MRLRRYQLEILKILNGYESINSYSFFHFDSRNKNHGFGVMHLQEIITTKHVEIKSRISRQRFTQNAFLKWVG